MDPIKQLIDNLGGLTAAAKAIGVSPQAINQWASGVRPVPIARCLAIEQLTRGAVTRKQLRPNDWRAIWPDLVASAAA